MTPHTSWAGLRIAPLCAEHLRGNLHFSISEIENACPGVSRDMVRLMLRVTKKESLIAPTGKGRGAKWIGLTNDTLPQGQPGTVDTEEETGGSQ